MFRNILIPTDGSPLSRKAAKNAVRLAREQKAKVTAVYVSPPYTPTAGEGMYMVHFESPQAYAARARSVASRCLGFVRKAASAAGVRYEEIHASSDFPYDEIVRTAARKKCDLIYMASHGRRGASRVILGSETSKVLAHSKVPVLVER
jgi:nucleotide-binding universal stress UspA family protein